MAEVTTDVWPRNAGPRNKWIVAVYVDGKRVATLYRRDIRDAVTTEIYYRDLYERDNRGRTA